MAYISCNTRIDIESMSEKSLVRLNQFLNRDSNIIGDYINIIKENENIVIVKKKVKAGELDKLTATTTTRTAVKHDLKSRYPRISLNELKECRDTATAMYNSYYALKGKGANFPTIKKLVPRSIGNRRFRLDTKRMVLSIMDSMDTNPRMIRMGKSRIRHNYLDIPIILSNYHFSKLEEGTLKSVKIYYKNNQLEVAFAIKVDVDQIKKYERFSDKPVAVLGIDLGINIAASTALLTPRGVSDINSFRLNGIASNYQKIEDQISQIMRTREIRSLNKLINNFDKRVQKMAYIKSYNPANNIKNLQNLIKQLRNLTLTSLPTVISNTKKLERDLRSIRGNLKSQKADKTLRDDIKRINNTRYSLELIKQLETQYDKHTDGVFSKLRKMRNDRYNLKLEVDRQMVNQLVNYITQLSNKYNLYISLGKLTGIRNIARRGNGNKAHRKRMHRWSYARVSAMLEHKLSLMGLEKRFDAVRESWTSIMCWKCNTKGNRPTQAIFECTNKGCDWTGNADSNGAINIAKRLVTRFTLIKSNTIGKKGLGKFLPAKLRNGKSGKVRNRPNPSRKTTGTRTSSQDDLPESTETQLPGAGHTNRDLSDKSQQPKLVLETKKLGSKMKMATSGWDGKNV